MRRRGWPAWTNLDQAKIDMLEIFFDILTSDVFQLCPFDQLVSKIS